MHAGEIAKAQLDAEHGLSIADARQDHFFQWKFRLLRAEILLNIRRAEDVVAQLDQPVPAGPRFAPLAARKLMLQGQAASILGRADEAAALLSEAHGIADAAHSEEALADIENVQGAQASKNKRYEAAAAFLRRALQRARTLRAPYLEASVLVNLGTIPFRQHRYDEAAGFFEEASRRAGPQMKLAYSTAQTNLATCYLNLGEFDRAIQIYTTSVALHQRSGAKSYLQLSLGQTGQAYLLKDELKSAIPYLQQALVSPARSAARSMPRSGPAISRRPIPNSTLGGRPPI